MKQTFEIMYYDVLYEVSIEFNASLRELIIFYVYNLEDTCYIDIRRQWSDSAEKSFRKEIVNSVLNLKLLNDSKYFN